LVTEKQQSERKGKGRRKRKKTSALLTVANFSGMGFLFFATTGGLLQINRLSGGPKSTRTSFPPRGSRNRRGLCRFPKYENPTTD